MFSVTSTVTTNINKSLHVPINDHLAPPSSLGLLEHTVELLEIIVDNVMIAVLDLFQSYPT